MSPVPEPVSNALLVAHLDDLRLPTHLAPLIAAAAQHARSQLTIVLFSPLFPSIAASDAPATALPPWDSIQRLLSYVYVQATRVAQLAHRPLTAIDVLLRAPSDGVPTSLAQRAQTLFRLQDDARTADMPWAPAHAPIVALPPGADPARPSPIPTTTAAADAPARVRVSALGGTFDHLHAGHKILLSTAAWITSEKLIVGVTDDALLKGKSNRHVMEDLEARSARVRAFLALFRPDLAHDVVAIADVAGPTGWDPDVQALVVSKETLAGADAIAKIRAEKGLPPLRTVVIDVISATEESLPDGDAHALREAKMSSTYLRQWIADHP